MAINNLNNVHLNPEQVTAAKEALSNLEKSLIAFDVNLSPEERKKFGSINEQNKLLVNKVRDYHRDKPSLSTSDIDWDEFERDFQSRAILESLIFRLEALTLKLKNAKILHDYDNYQAALADYAYTNYRSGTGAEGFENKYTDMKQFFSRTRKAKNTSENNNQ